MMKWKRRTKKSEEEDVTIVPKKDLVDTKAQKKEGEETGR